MSAFSLVLEYLSTINLPDVMAFSRDCLHTDPNTRLRPRWIKIEVVRDPWQDAPRLKHGRILIVVVLMRVKN